MLEKQFFEPKVTWMRKTKQPWERENIKVRLEKRMSLLEVKDVDSVNILGLKL